MAGRPEGQARGSHGRDIGVYLELAADEGAAPVLVGPCWPKAGPRHGSRGMAHCRVARGRWSATRHRHGLARVSKVRSGPPTAHESRVGEETRSAGVLQMGTVSSAVAARSKG